MRRALWALAGLLIWAVTVALAAAPRTVPAGTVAAVLGSVLGAVIAWRLAGSRLRLPVIWAGGLLLVLATRLAASLLVGTRALPSLLGTGAAFTLSEMLLWLGGALATVAVLQTSSRRHPAFVALEILAVGAVLGGVLAAHREGLISRPHTLVDVLWGRGYDPLPFFLGFGALVVALLALLAAHRGSRRRSILDGLLIVALVLLAFLLIPVGVVKVLEPPGGGGGGTGQDQGGQGGQGGTDSPTSSFADQKDPSGGAPVAVVLLHDDYDPPSGYYYLRQTAFSQFNGQRLVQATLEGADADVVASFPSGRTEVELEVSRRDLFRALDTTVALLQPHPRPFALVNPEALAPAPNPDPVRFVRAYTVGSQVQVKPLPELAELHVGHPLWSRELARHYTEGPSDRRYSDLAASCVELLRPELRLDPFAQAVAIQYWLGKSSTYSRRSSHEAAPDPLADFLFGDRIGHCVYLSHAACLLFRARGIPARVGAGYAVDGRTRGNGGALLVRDRDAHAWPEIYLYGIGWLPMDIAPEKSLDPPDEGPDQGLQQMLGEMARRGRQPPPADQEPAGGGNLQEALRAVARAAGLVLAALALLAVVALYAAKIWRRLAPAFCRAERLPVVAYRAALDRLADGGVRRRFGQTREAFAAAEAAFSPAFGELTRLHLEAALGRTRPPLSRSAALALGRRTAAELARSVRWWRRWLGLVDPLSWLWVR